MRKCEERTIDEEFRSTMDQLSDESGVREQKEDYDGKEVIDDDVDEVDGYMGCVRCRQAKAVLDNGMELERVAKALGKGSPKCLRESIGMDKEWMWRIVGKKKWTM